MTTFISRSRVRLLLALAALVAVAPPINAEEVGTVAAVEGTAEILRGGTWSVATTGAGVATGDNIRTGRPGHVRIVFRDDSVLVLSDATTILIDQQVYDPNASQSVFGLLQGKLKSVASHYYGAPGSRYEVQTPTAVAGVRGTEFVMSYDPATGATEVVGIRGVISVHSSVDPAGPGILVTASEASAVALGELPSPVRQLDPEDMRQLLRDMEFFGSNQGANITDSSSLIAGAMVPRPARAPAAAVGRGAALVLAPEGSVVGLDAGGALGNSPAAVVSAGGSGSIGVNPGHR